MSVYLVWSGSTLALYGGLWSTSYSCHASCGMPASLSTWMRTLRHVWSYPRLNAGVRVSFGLHDWHSEPLPVKERRQEIQMCLLLMVGIHTSLGVW
jgi:hypothetical protein